MLNGSGGGRFGQVPSTSTATESRQLPSFGYGGWGGGGVDQCTPFHPCVEFVGEDQQYGHRGRCSQSGMPSGYDPTAMFAGRTIRRGGSVSVLCTVLGMIGLGSAGVGWCSRIERVLRRPRALLGCCGSVSPCRLHLSCPSYRRLYRCYCYASKRVRFVVRTAVRNAPTVPTVVGYFAQTPKALEFVAAVDDARS